MKRIDELLNLSLAIESQEQRGTLASIFIPVSQDKNSNEVERIKGSQDLIAVVTQDIQTAEVISDLLESWNVSALVFKNEDDTSAYLESPARKVPRLLILSLRFLLNQRMENDVFFDDESIGIYLDERIEEVETELCSSESAYVCIVRDVEGVNITGDYSVLDLPIQPAQLRLLTRLISE